MNGYAYVNEKGYLELDGWDCVDLADRFGTPLFVISEERIRLNYREFNEAFKSIYPNVLVCFSCKSNLGLAWNKVIESEGGAVEAFGRYELYIALQAGFDPNNIIFNGVNRTEEDFQEAIAAGVKIHVDQLEELEAVDEAADVHGEVEVCLRIVPSLHELDSKYITDYRFSPPQSDLGAWVRDMQFGMDLETAYKAYKRSLDLKNIHVNGLIMHCGNPRRAGYQKVEIVEMFDFIGRLKREFGFEPEVVDLGGGFIPSESILRGQLLSWPDNYSARPIKEDAAEIVSIVKGSCEVHDIDEPILMVEPGKWLAYSTALMLARVGHIKELYGRKIAFLDAGTDLIRPLKHEYHHIVVANKMDLEPEEKINFVGSTCTAAESLFAGGGGREVPKLDCGDLVAVLDVGAYGESKFGSHNAIPKPATIMVRSGDVAVVRERETFQDVIAHEKIPNWLCARARRCSG